MPEIPSVLLIDDEEAVLLATAQMLRTHGYTPFFYTSPMKAVEAFRAAPSQFDLVITDMTMPGKTGVEVGRELLQIRPDLPVILTTGFSEAITKEKALDAGFSDFLPKPYGVAALTSAVDNVLHD